MEARFDLFGDSANLDARLVHDLQGTYHMLRNQYGRTQWNIPFWSHCLVLLGEEAQVEAWFGQFGDSANPYAR